MGSRFNCCNILVVLLFFFAQQVVWIITGFCNFNDTYFCCSLPLSFSLKYNTTETRDF